MRPIRDYLLVSPIQREEVFGGIIVVGKLDSTLRGTVLKVGAEAKEVKEGETILYHEGQGLKITEGGKDYVLIREAELSLVL